MPEATSQEINRFVKTVDEFTANFKHLKSPAVSNAVYASNDQKLIADYENGIIQAGRLNGTIISTVGAWNAAKQSYAEITGTTSTVIGDAIDEVRSWFGYKPAGDFAGLGFLGAVQLPALALSAIWIGGIVAAAIVANNMMSNLFIRVEAARLQSSGVSPERALQIASDTYSPGLFEGWNTPLLIGGALAAWWLLSQRK